MKVKNIVWEDFCNYKKASLFILTPYCSFKCEQDCGEKCCTDIIDFIKKFRKICDDEIIIYSGYTESELKDKIEILNQYPNIIIKFGRFIPHQKSHFDDTLGIYLASENQYAKQIS